MNLKYIFLTLVLFFFTFTLVAQQKRHVEYKSSLQGNVATEKNLPFWQVSDRFGVVPPTSNGLLQAGFFSGFTGNHSIDFAYGLSGAAYSSRDKNKAILDEAYVAAKWKKVRLDLGFVRPEVEYNGISSTNGNIINSGNTRTKPGYNLRTDFIKVPLTGNILSFKFNWSDYLMIDNLYADNIRLHHKSFYINIKPVPRIDIIVGLEQWAQWGGTTPQGKQPSSFRDYVRIVCAEEGGKGASQSDSLNVLGNHLGREYLRINYNADNYTLSFYHDIPFEDGSGTRFANFPDGTYGLYYGSKDKKQWISDVMYELTYTKKQSGRYHDRKATPEEIEKQDPHSPFYGRVVLGGNDNYFNHGEYRSGWTYYGNTIGTPFITPTPPDKDGITMGVFNNRLIAHYIGMKGYFMRKLPYLLRLSYSLNYGTYNIPLPHRPEQFSFGLEVGVLRTRKLPFHVDLGIYGDYGKLLSNNFGVSVSLSRNGLIK